MTEEGKIERNSQPSRGRIYCTHAPEIGRHLIEYVVSNVPWKITADGEFYVETAKLKSLHFEALDELHKLDDRMLGLHENGTKYASKNSCFVVREDSELEVELKALYSVGKDGQLNRRSPAAARAMLVKLWDKMTREEETLRGDSQPTFPPHLLGENNASGHANRIRVQRASAHDKNHIIPSEAASSHQDSGNDASLTGKFSRSFLDGLLRDENLSGKGSPANIRH